MQIHFCTFGNTELYTRSLEILREEAEKSGYFNTVNVYTEVDIPEEYHSFIKENKRGYGYWIYKPLLLLDMFYKTKAGDVIVYADAGCGISTTKEARENWNSWIHDVTTHDSHIVSFQTPHTEEKYTKAELFHLMECNEDKYKKTGIFQASVQIYMNTSENISLIQEQLRIMKYDKYHYLSDAPSYIKNPDTFLDHRHDQSILSLLYKKINTCSREDHYNNYHYPIVTIRRKFF
jgi:hypothetical protein